MPTKDEEAVAPVAALIAAMIGNPKKSRVKRFGDILTNVAGWVVLLCITAIVIALTIHAWLWLI